MSFIEFSKSWDYLNAWLIFSVNIIACIIYGLLLFKVSSTKSFSLLLCISSFLLAIGMLGQLVMLHNDLFPFQVHAWRAIFIIRAACQSVGPVLVLVGTFYLYRFVRQRQHDGNHSN